MVRENPHYWRPLPSPMALTLRAGHAISTFPPTTRTPPCTNLSRWCGRGTQRTVSSYGHGNRSLHQKSHGEGFLTLVGERFQGEGLYLLDEPESALSPANQLTLIALIHRLVQEGAQFIIATHSPILMTYPGACLYQLDSNGIQAVPYAQTEHYRLTRRFLNNPDHTLRYLLGEKS